MGITTMLRALRHKINRVPSKYLVITGLILFCASLYVVSFRERSIEYSYGGETCQRQFVFFPKLFQASASSDYTMTTEDVVTVLGVPLVSTSLCFTANTTPSNDAQPVAISFLGSWFARIAYKVTVPEVPKASFDVLKAPIPATKPLTIKLDKPDETFLYSIRTETGSIDCKSVDAHLSCDIPALKLEQGQTYDLSVMRRFKQQSPETLASISVKTLSPIAITASSITEGATVYDRPTGIVVQADKSLKTISFELVKLSGDAKTTVPVTTTIKDTAGTITFSAPLERSSEFLLTSKTFEATDGSTLTDPYNLRFKTSGGPTVSAVSVSATGVSANAQIVVTFDQPIQDSTDIASVARVVGVTGSVRKQSPTQLVFSLQNATQCATFSLVIDKGVKSASNDLLSQEAWKFDGRIICGSSSVIGYSVRGRPIVAYYFGSGATTVLMTGGMHGSEPSGTTTMQAFVTYLQTNAYKIPSDKRVVIVPNTNPDAIAVGSRNNANNVNIDRNFPTANWTSSIETANGTLAQGGGTSAGSEAETKALMAVTRQLRPRLEVSFHAQGRLVGANKAGDSVAIGDIYATTVGYKTMYYNAEEVMGGYAMTGEYEDWMGEELGTPAILIELPSASGNYLQAQLTALWKMISI